MRLIDADEIKDRVGYIEYEYGHIMEEINNAPTVDAVERKRGRWRHYEGYLTCSECGVEYDDDIMTYCGDNVPKFCPNCGADMRGENNG